MKADWIKGLPTESGPHWLMEDDGEVRNVEIGFDGGSPGVVFDDECGSGLWVINEPCWHAKIELPGRPNDYIPQPTVFFFYAYSARRNCRGLAGSRRGRSLQMTAGPYGSRRNTRHNYAYAEAWTAEEAKELARAKFAEWLAATEKTK